FCGALKGKGEGNVQIVQCLKKAWITGALSILTDCLYPTGRCLRPAKYLMPFLEYDHVNKHKLKHTHTHTSVLLHLYIPCSRPSALPCTFFTSVHFHTFLPLALAHHSVSCAVY